MSFWRENLLKLQPQFDANKMPLLIFVNKGIEVGTHALTLEIVADTCGSDVAKAATFIVRVYALWSVQSTHLKISAQSGPSFARESKNHPYKNVHR